MKKICAMLLCLVLVMSMFTGCKSAENDTTKDTPDPTATAAPTAGTSATEAPAADDSTTDAAVKTGLAVVTSIAKSADAAADKDGLGEVDSMIAAVLVDKDGKIVACKIDAAQTKINFSAEGKLITDPATVFQTKQELKEGYNMKGSSSISKEWYEQADGFAAYCVGKTVDQIKGIAVNEDGVASDADVAATITVHIGDFIEVVTKAATNAADLGAKAGDKLGLATSTDMGQSKDASAEGDGLAQAYSYYTALTLDKDGKITSCAIDASQGNVNFSTAGAVTSDLTVAPQTKQELKEAYDMKKASGIGKEWYEQANAFAVYATGKTVADVKGIAVTEDGKASGADLTASVTVHVTPFISNIEKAATNAQ